VHEHVVTLPEVAKQGGGLQVTIGGVYVLHCVSRKR
jgi:hypothetical protein